MSFCHTWRGREAKLMGLALSVIWSGLNTKVKEDPVGSSLNSLFPPRGVYGPPERVRAQTGDSQRGLETP